MALLEIRDLHARIGDAEILHGINLTMTEARCMPLCAKRIR